MTRNIFNVANITNPFRWKQEALPAAISNSDLPPAVLPLAPPALLPLTAPQQFAPIITPPVYPPTPGIPYASIPIAPGVNIPTYGQQPTQQKPPAGLDYRTPGGMALLRESIRREESGHDYQAKNPTTSASGAYQYINRTWGNFGGYSQARYAPRHVQDAKFNQDLVGSLRQFNGDPFRVIANHMLPTQANKPWLWSQPSRLKDGKGGWVTIPPVANYVKKIVRGSPLEAQFNAYVNAYSRQ